jgi:large subunit ribosomal protein L22
MEARASSKYLRGSAQKARLVVDMIRGKQVSDALAILQFTNKRAATPIEKCLRSAIANATEAAERGNIAVDPDDLWVKACFVDMGPTKNRRRVRPAPQGRAYREQRHFCHVTVLLSTEGKENGPAGKGASGGRAKKADSPAGKKGAKGEPKRTPAAKAAKGTGAEKKTTKKEDASAKPEANAATTEETAQE